MQSACKIRKNAGTPSANGNSHTWLCQFSWEGALGNTFVILTGGAFLTSLALYLGAGDFEIGLLCAMPFLAQVAQMFSSFLINLIGNRKKLTLLGFFGGRLIWLLMIPALFFNFNEKLEAFLLLVIISNILVMIATPGWLSWISDLVPARVRGRYFGRRNSAIAISTVISTISGGLILDHFKLLQREYVGYIVIIAIACLMATISVIILRRLPDQSDSKSGHYRLKQIIEPLREKRFRHLLAVFFTWNMSIGISAVFFAVHMLTNLRMSFTQIALYTCGTALSAIFLNKPWGQLIDRFGSKPVLSICAFGIAFIPLIWFVPRADFLWILIFESIYTGALWAGFNLAAFNIPIANSPKESRPSYLAAFSVLTGAGFFLASLLGGIIAESLSAFQYPVGPQTLVNYHVLFAISSVLRIVAAVLFLSFHEPTEKRLTVMLHFIGYAALKHLSVGRQILPLGAHIEKNSETRKGDNNNP